MIPANWWCLLTSAIPNAAYEMRVCINHLELIWFHHDYADYQNVINTVIFIIGIAMLIINVFIMSIDIVMLFAYSHNFCLWFLLLLSVSWFCCSIKNHSRPSGHTLHCWFTCSLTHHASQIFNTLRPRHNCRHFPNGIFKCIFMNKNKQRFHLSVFPRVQLIIFQHWFR